MTGEIASVGGWEFDVETMEGRWTEEVARIHEVDPDLKPDVAWALSFYTDDSRPKIERAVNDAISRACHSTWNWRSSVRKVRENG